MFYDKFISLCAQKGQTPAQVSKSIGLSNATATGWKHGKKPNDITIKRLSAYFGVSVEELKETENIFYRNYLRLCNSVKKSPSAVAIEIGIAKATVSRWKSGGTPTDATLQKIANYFGVPVSELTGEDVQKEKADPLEGIGLSPAKQAAWDLIKKMDEKTVEKFIKIAKVVLGDETL